MRKEIKNQEQLERYLASREKSCDLKALVLKMVVKIGDVKEQHPLAGERLWILCLEGEGCFGFFQDAKAESIEGFLAQVKEANRGLRGVIVLLDNLPSHRAKGVQEKAGEEGIWLVYLPPYSPDLNPIEQIWRVVKRVISSVLVEGIEQMKGLLRETFEKCVPRLSFCREWISRFFNPVWNATFNYQ